ncbi:4Fe-4S binding protein [Maridesulfovibrio hydrothermalis]|uniref:4Fe-4S ferredoxin iron-sulfur binding domain protein n=1 Tax=Maridesulfovibrio hydrothermalis AM13 = DSM 14728 TaxID=1121451 RepID=L0RHJ9_9BACT|nr:4Fe-4S binding protein [Maridesulfovibrio hydrothermalis]CCO25051.1 4Fe-4S ferredoxin iron-sulfur binding domain protein [Maridesulfovibrio hydrothermalis AM13 = DSM 14728]
MTAIKKIWENVTGLWSLVVGLKVTGKNFADKQITLHYPRETVSEAELEGFRGPLELVGKPKDPAKAKCIACMMCVTACPSKCLTVVKAKAPKPTEAELQAMKEAQERGEKVKKPKAPKEPVKFIYDFSLCSLCGSCVENCPVDSLRYSSNVYFVSTDRKDFTMDLLGRLEKKAQAAESVKAEKTPPEAPEAADVEPSENSTRKD